MQDYPPDFEIVIRADSTAEGNIPGRPVDESDFGHVRAWLNGFLLQADAALPAGWSLQVTAHGEVATQTEAVGDPTRDRVVDLPPDRFASVETAECATEGCGLMIRREGPRGAWYHVPSCTDPHPPAEHALLG